MAILWMEGFDNANGVEDLLWPPSALSYLDFSTTNKWGQITSSLELGQNIVPSLAVMNPIFPSGSGVQEGGVAFWTYHSNGGFEGTRGMLFSDSDGVQHFRLDWRTGPSLVLYWQTGNTAVAWTRYVWTHYEVQFKIHDTEGYIVVRRNALDEIISQSNIDTLGSGADPELCTFAFGTHNIGGNSDAWDDIVIYDFSSPNQGWLGLHRIRELPLSASGANSDFTRSAGTENYENVDDAIPDGDTSYNYSGNSAAIDDFTLETYSGEKNISAIAVSFDARQESVDTTQLYVGLDTGTEIVSGTFDVQNTTEYNRKTLVVHNNPDDDQPWDVADLTDLKIRYEIV